MTIRDGIWLSSLGDYLNNSKSEVTYWSHRTAGPDLLVSKPVASITLESVRSKQIAPEDNQIKTNENLLMSVWGDLDSWA